MMVFFIVVNLRYEWCEGRLSEGWRLTRSHELIKPWSSEGEHVAVLRRSSHLFISRGCYAFICSCFNNLACFLDGCVFCMWNNCFFWQIEQFLPNFWNSSKWFSKANQWIVQYCGPKWPQPPGLPRRSPARRPQASREAPAGSKPSQSFGRQLLTWVPLPHAWMRTYMLRNMRFSLQQEHLDQCLSLAPILVQNQSPIDPQYGSIENGSTTQPRCQLLTTTNAPSAFGQTAFVDCLGMHSTTQEYPVERATHSAQLHNCSCNASAMWYQVEPRSQSQVALQGLRSRVLQLTARGVLQGKHSEFETTLTPTHIQIHQSSVRKPVFCFIFYPTIFSKFIQPMTNKLTKLS